MSDFESRLTDALSSGAEGAPDASGLAEGARRRSRRRRRTTGVVAAAAVVAAVAVPVGVVALRDGGSDNGNVAEDPSPSPGTPSDTRIETWHGIQVEVPASWGYGARSAWCTGGEAETPVVERPGGVVATIACDPTYSYGVSWVGETTMITPVNPSGEVWRYEPGDVAEYPAGAWLGYWYDDQDMVQVAAADKETVQEILDSVERVEAVDGNGCPVVDDGDAGDLADDEVAVCRYSADGQLEQSERLVGDDAEAARAAVEAVPVREGADDCANPDGEYVMLTVDGDRAEVQYSGGPCSDRGLFFGDEARELTSDVMYWALSPGWFGSVEGWVPLPDQLRTLPKPEPTEPPAEESVCPEGYFANSDFALDADNGEPMTICRMELTWEGESGGTHLLADTTELTEAESDAVRDALAAAPVMERSDFKDCRTGPGEFFLVRAGDAVPLWVYNGECGELTALTLAVNDDVVHHEVTPELLDALGSPYGLLR
jgi:hypothetical protein